MAVDDPDPTTGEARVGVDGVSKRFSTPGGAVQALRDVSFAVAPGEFVVVVGPSGSGKTTLFRVIAGLEEPTGGAVYLDGERVEGPGPDMGVVFQEYHLFPWRTARENVAFGLEKRNVPADERDTRVTDLLELVGLGDAADSYPKELSGGMKQRVGIARALAVDPEFLLMDEPFGAVDAQTRGVLQDELLELRAHTGKTILFVTHDVEEAVKLADRVVVMDAEPGEIRDIVDVELARPRSRSDEAFGEYYERVLELIRDYR
jgi:NitT/TauT family transport system ATP-binding protein